MARPGVGAPGEARSLTGLVWPDPLPVHGPIVLRPYTPADLDLVAELSADPYVPLIGTVPAEFTRAAGAAYLRRQHQRLTDGTGWSFAVADRHTDRALGGASLWPQGSGWATAGYTVAPSVRGRGIATAALHALTTFAWTVGDLERVELFIEPANIGSITVARRCGYAAVELVAGHGEIGGQRRDMWRYVADRRRLCSP